LAHVKRLANRLIADEDFRKQAVPFRNLVNALIVASSVGYQGVTVGGVEGMDVRIINNTISGFLQGIHVGLSRKNDRSRLPAGTVAISGNNIAITLALSGANKDRHGIFVGSCDSLLIDNNRARLTRQAGTESLVISGIEVRGELGGRALVTQNHLDSASGDFRQSFNIGIVFSPLSTAGLNKLWRVDHNVAPSKVATVQVRLNAGILEEVNIPKSTPPA
jgi:hypothetical protein